MKTMIITLCKVDLKEAARRGFVPDGETVSLMPSDEVIIPITVESLPFPARDVLSASLKGREFTGPPLPEPTEHGLLEVLTQMIMDRQPVQMTLNP